MMGRIDEALRRAGTLPPRDSEATDERDALFVAPWRVGDEKGPPEPPNTAREDSDVRDDEVPGPASRLRVVRPTRADGLMTGWRERLCASDECDAGLSEEFRQLAASLLHSQRRDRLKTIMVASAVPADGKTLVSLNLAMVLSQSYRHSVLLIDADLRRPSISQALNIRTGEGLSEGLRARQEQRMSLVPLSDTLTLLPAGRPDPDPLSGLTSPRMAKLIKGAADQFDWVILDTPPVGAAADAGLLCPMVQGALLVVRAGRTPYKAIQHAVDTLGRERILGVVLNAAEHRTTRSYYNYYHDHATGLDR